MKSEASAITVIPFGTAIVTFSVIEFHKLGDPGHTDYKVSLDTNGCHAITLDARGNSLLVAFPATACASHSLAFILSPSETENYVPIGIALKLDGSSDPDSFANFATTTIRNGILIVTDNGAQTYPWEFDIVIQRESDGALSTIDPRITNTLVWNVAGRRSSRRNA